MYTVDVDTGGTMTDALVMGDGAVHTFKVDTTPHDLTVSFRQVLVEAARQLGHGNDLASFLDEVTLIRWSSTITSNALGERSGSKIGLLVRAGHEHDLYGPGESPAVGSLVADRNVLGLADLNTQAVLETVKKLLEVGVRRVCVSFDGAFPDNSAELEVKAIIESQYPDHYLGAVPVLPGSEMAQVVDDNARTHCSLINAYVHSHLAASLFKAEDILKYDEGWDGPLLVGHINGGVARVGKTKALDTIESGPVFGTHAAAFFAKRYGLSDVICLDVGGTTAKVGIVHGGEPVFTRGGELFGIPVQASLALVHSCAIGGGSVAQPVGTGGVRLGPESMGAAPGPASYGLGGDEATVTDAFLVLGYLDPDRFLDGRRKLDLERAREFIGRRVAEPLGLSVEEAAQTIADAAVDMIAELVSSTLAKGGGLPEDSVIFAYGGNGGLFALPVAERLGIRAAYVFNLGPVFSAFGSAVSDVVHVYERGVVADLGAAETAAQVRAAGRMLHATARRDLEGEGFDPDQAAIDVEVDLRSNGGLLQSIRVGAYDDNSLLDDILRATADATGSGVVDLLRLRACYSVGTYDPARSEDGGGGGSQAVGDRRIMLSTGAITAPVHDWYGLARGDSIAGPAVAAGGAMTVLVLPGWTLAVDEFGNGGMQRADS